MPVKLPLVDSYKGSSESRILVVSWEAVESELEQARMVSLQKQLISCLPKKCYRKEKDFAEDYPRNRCIRNYRYGFVLENIERLPLPIYNILGKRFFLFVKP
jgi:hypothetical protein